ncbi:MAG: hypothetical protein LBC18_03290 [Opitutaceae bacterium]|jgi:hypothetical protein|nr:hypothetical protein [Opitutaceae bacterium]
MQKLRRDIHPASKVIDEAAGIVEYTASDETLDYQHEIVRAAGWRFTRFAKNAPFVDSHDYSSITKLLGRVEAFEVTGGKLIERVRYSLEPGTLAFWAFKMVRDGFLKAVSVGFQPVRAVSKWDASPLAFAAECAALGLDAQAAAAVRVIFLEQEQLELSQCVLGANPNALARAYKAGTLTEEDIDKFLAQITTAKTVSPTASPAEVEATRRRARMALLLEIQNNL